MPQKHDWVNGNTVDATDVNSWANAINALSNVDNTSDVNKPVSTAQATADTAVLTSATGRAIAFAIALG
jgi:hypothetical protein